MRALLVLLVASAGCQAKKEPLPDLAPEDMITIPSGPFLGTEHRCPTAPMDDLLDVPPPVRMQTDGFLIDRRVASCDDIRRCVEAGGCPKSVFSPLEQPVCYEGVATPQFAVAAAYCRWRNAGIPSYRQWQRSARGTDGREYPDGHQRPRRLPVGSCRTSSQYWYVTRCTYVSPTGMEYATHSPALGEWTRDPSCARPPADPKRLGVYTIGVLPATVDLREADYAEVRCVRDH